MLTCQILFMSVLVVRESNDMGLNFLIKNQITIKLFFCSLARTYFFALTISNVKCS
jgi:hypothetical protein